MSTTTAPQPRLKTRFENDVIPKLGEIAGTTNRHALPKLDKIMISVGMGKQLDGTKVKASYKDQVLKDIALIAGQKPVLVKAKESVSNFKVREGYETGVMVTLRGVRAWEFYDRLMSLAIPRIKDFRGLKDRSFDGRGNYSFGLTEQGLFPEVDMANASASFGMHITLVWKQSTDELSKAAMKELGWPFIKREKKKAA